MRRARSGDQQNGAFRATLSRWCAPLRAPLLPSGHASKFSTRKVLKTLSLLAQGRSLRRREMRASVGVVGMNVSRDHSPLIKQSIQYPMSSLGSVRNVFVDKNVAGRRKGAHERSRARRALHATI